MKSLMLQRICSSFASGLKTAQRMLKHSVSNEDEDEDSVEKVEHILSEMTPAEVSGLKEIETQLSRPEAVPAKTFEPRRSQSGDSTTLSVISCVFMASIICFVSFMVINSEVDDE